MNTPDPKQKALEIVEKFSFFKPKGITDVIDDVMNDLWKPYAKQCAIIAVNEMIEEYQCMSDLESIIICKGQPKSVIELMGFWQSVLTEIEKL